MKVFIKGKDICWFAKEAHDLDKYTHSWNRHEDIPELSDAADSSLLLECRGTYVHANKSALMKEALFFDSRFGKFWNKKSDEAANMTGLNRIL